MTTMTITTMTVTTMTTMTTMTIKKRQLICLWNLGPPCLGSQAYLLVLAKWDSFVRLKQYLLLVKQCRSRSTIILMYQFLPVCLHFVTRIIVRCKFFWHASQYPSQEFDLHSLLFLFGITLECSCSWQRYTLRHQSTKTTKPTGK